MMCLKMMPRSFTPRALAAVTYSISRWARIWALMMKARLVQLRRPSTTMMMYIRSSTLGTRGPKMADMISIRGRKGTDPTNSARRQTRMSTTPPK